MPPVPTSCAAIMRSASVGPCRMRTRPSATIASTKPAARSRKSAMRAWTSECLQQHGFLRGQLRRHRLADVEAMDEQGRRSRRSRTGSVPGSRLVIVQNAFRVGPAGQLRPIGHEARPQRQSRIERAPCDVDAGANGLAQESAAQVAPGRTGAASTVPAAAGAGLPRPQWQPPGCQPRRRPRQAQSGSPRSRGSPPHAAIALHHGFGLDAGTQLRARRRAPALSS